MIDFDAIRTRHSLVDVAAGYLPTLRRKGSEYVALCPFHNEKNPSFSIFRGRDGLFRYRCWACGAGLEHGAGDVIDFVAAINCTSVAEAAAMLDGDRLPVASSFTPTELPPDESDCWEPILPVPADAPAYDPAATYNPRRSKVVRWRPSRQDAVRAPGGGLLGYVLRLDFDDGAKICPTVTFCEGPGGVRRWAAKRFPRPTPLVGLDELYARPDAAVLVVSGEKCRERAAAALGGFVVVTWIGGDPGVEYADLEPLRGRSLTLWPDADDSGVRAMARLAERLS